VSCSVPNIRREYWQSRGKAAWQPLSAGSSHQIWKQSLPEEVWRASKYENPTPQNKNSVQIKLHEHQSGRVDEGLEGRAQLKGLVGVQHTGVVGQSDHHNVPADRFGSSQMAASSDTRLAGNKQPSNQRALTFSIHFC